MKTHRFKIIFLAVCSSILNSMGEARATSYLQPCFRYSYEEHFELGEEAPQDLKIMTSVGSYKGQFLANPSGKSLVLKVSEHKCIKLQKGLFYEAQNCAMVKNKNNEESAEIRIQGYTRLDGLAKNRTVNDIMSLGSNQRPRPQPVDYRFELDAEWNGRPIKIPVKASYRLKEQNCKVAE